MKTPTGNRNLDKLILAIGIVMAIVAGLSSSYGDNNFGTSFKANVIKSAATGSDELLSKTKTCNYPEGRLTIN